MTAKVSAKVPLLDHSHSNFGMVSGFRSWPAWIRTRDQRIMRLAREPRHVSAGRVEPRRYALFSNIRLARISVGLGGSCSHPQRRRGVHTFAELVVRVQRSSTLNTTRVSAMKTMWTGRVAQAAGKYGENAPMATVCCNACRTCVTTNIVGVAMAGIAGAGYTVTSFARRRLFAKRS